MSTKTVPARIPASSSKRLPLVASVRSTKSAIGEIAKVSRLQTPNPQPKNGGPGFDAEGFLARTGLGKKKVESKKK